MKIIKETDKYIKYETGYKYCPVRTEKKFLCVGGPLHGKTTTETHITQEKLYFQPYRTLRLEPQSGYERYNAASSGKHLPNCLFVWIDLPQ